MWWRVILCCLFGLLALASTGAGAQEPPHVTFTPDSGPPGSFVEFSGEGFTDPSWKDAAEAGYPILWFVQEIGSGSECELVVHLDNAELSLSDEGILSGSGNIGTVGGCKQGESGLPAAPGPYWVSFDCYACTIGAFTITEAAATRTTTQPPIDQVLAFVPVGDIEVDLCNGTDVPVTVSSLTPESLAWDWADLHLYPIPTPDHRPSHMYATRLSAGAIDVIVGDDDGLLEPSEIWSLGFRFEELCNVPPTPPPYSIMVSAAGTVDSDGASWCVGGWGPCIGMSGPLIQIGRATAIATSTTTTAPSTTTPTATVATLPVTGPDGDRLNSFTVAGVLLLISGLVLLTGSYAFSRRRD